MTSPHKLLWYNPTSSYKHRAVFNITTIWRHRN